MKGFISYAHADHAMYQEFCKFLTPAARHFGVEFWSDPILHTGQDWNQAIADAIDTAEVFIALVLPVVLNRSRLSAACCAGSVTARRRDRFRRPSNRRHARWTLARQPSRGMTAPGLPAGTGWPIIAGRPMAPVAKHKGEAE